jgi:O-antigen ligase
MKSKSPLLKLVHFLVCLSPFIFPFYLVRFELFGIPFTALEAYSYALALLFIFALFTGQFRFSRATPGRWYYYLIFILFVGTTLGVVAAPHYIALPSGMLMDSQRATLGVWKGWVVAPMLYFVVLTQVISRPEELKKVLLNFVYSGALVALASYAFGVFDSGVTYDFRLSGFFESANYLSLYLVPALLLGTYYLLNFGTLDKRNNFLNLVAVTIMAHALFMTQSYAAIIGVFGSLILYILVVLVRQRVRMRNVLIAFGLLFITFLAIVGSQYNSRKFQQFIDLENRSSSSVRLEIYEISWNLVKDHPMTGVGPGLFQGFYQTKGPDYLGRAPMEWNIPHPHNVFFAFWLNAGLLGFLAFLGLVILAHFRLTYPLLALWGILIHGLFDTPFWKNDLAMIFWLILAAILILQTHGSSSHKKPAGPIRKRAGIKRSASVKASKLKAKK